MVTVLDFWHPDLLFLTFSANITQELVPNHVLPDDFVRAIKNIDYNSVSS